MPSQSWSIVVFGYNEEHSLAPTVAKIRAALQEMQTSQYEIILVDDGSTDGSPQILEELKKGEHVRVIRHPRNLGIGYALHSGYQAANLENVVAVPADGQFNPAELVPFANFAPNTFVSFFRTEKAGYSGFRKRLSNAHRLVNYWLMDLSLQDVNWVKAYKTKSLQGLDLKTTSSLIESEICAKLLFLGYQVTETPSIYHARLTGRAKGASFKAIYQAVRETLMLARVVRRYRKSREAARRRLAA